VKKAFYVLLLTFVLAAPSLADQDGCVPCPRACCHG
jgi:hypothetical protein